MQIFRPAMIAAGNFLGGFQHSNHAFDGLLFKSFLCDLFFREEAYIKKKKLKKSR